MTRLLVFGTIAVIWAALLIVVGTQVQATGNSCVGEADYDGNNYNLACYGVCPPDDCPQEPNVGFDPVSGLTFAYCAACTGGEPTCCYMIVIIDQQGNTPAFGHAGGCGSGCGASPCRNDTDEYGWSAWCHPYVPWQ